MKRRNGSRARSRVGRASQARIRSGGKLALGRESETLAGWRAVVAQVRERAKDRCEIHGYHPGTDPHHVQFRSRGGADHPDNVIWLCRHAHDMVSAAYARGRLEIRALGGGRFEWTIVKKTRKHSTEWTLLEAGTT